MSEHIRTELADGVLTVTLNRPDKKNALTQAMYTGLAEAAERARTDDAVRVLLFRAEGDSFCAGNDIQDFISLGSQTQTPSDLPVFRFLKSLADLDKPAVAAARGRAVGVGMTMLPELRPGGPGRGRPVVRALRQSGHRARGGVQPVAAGGDRASARLRDVGVRRGCGRAHGPGLGHGQSGGFRPIRSMRRPRTWPRRSPQGRPTPSARPSG